MKSFNASQAAWDKQHDLLQQLYGPTEEERRDRALEETCLRLGMDMPVSEAEQYAALECLDHLTDTKEDRR